MACIVEWDPKAIKILDKLAKEEAKRIVAKDIRHRKDAYKKR